MSNAQDRVVIVGAGHNGLVAACYLARAGLRPLVLEWRERVGGGALTEEFHPGFRCPTLEHALGPVLPEVARELELERHGLSLITPDARLFALDPEGRSFTVYDDAARTARSLEALSPRDARAYADFRQSFERIGRVLAPVVRSAPPSIESPSAAEAWSFLKLGKEFRGLGKRDAYRLLRWGPMAVADLAAEWFETELVRAAVAARGIHGSFAGPWSAGTSLGLLMQAAFDGQPFPAASFARGGPGALTEALAHAAQAAGAELRTGADVARVTVRDGRAAGVVLEGGEEIAARAVVSNADPRQTFLRLVEPTELDPDFLAKVRGYRSAGAAAKVNFALGALPAFATRRKIESGAEELRGRIHVGPEIDYLERAFDAAKYGDFSPAPYLDITIPTLSDPGLAPEGRHVMSVHAQFAPYKLREGDWKARRGEFADAVARAVEAHAPGFGRLILARQIITPLDLEQTYGLSGGHIHHGEMSLDQFFTFRPVIGWAQYRTPLRGLYLCGAGTHPGGGLTGAPGRIAAREILKDLKSRQ
ncbi:MAG TPA: NAD(P)/FAD-dependent oxidoreductase [Pyrinomonadaceae bacterium]|nr:NAD(P)/FAD-dependent oxidoreductase [Pyrinomonadaceae bacterium]